MRSEQSSIFRALDANFNRASEALRVLEDIVRFQYDDRLLTESLKNLRHCLTAQRVALGDDKLAGFRDTPSDVGTGITTERENTRTGIKQIIAANCRRFAESIRVIEELCKLPSLNRSKEAESLRYQFYSVEKSLFALSAQKSLYDVVLALRIPASCQSIQLLEIIASHKGLGGIMFMMDAPDMRPRELLELARACVALSRKSGGLVVIGHRPDICLLADADGVVLNGDDLSPFDVRKITGSSSLIGYRARTSEGIGNIGDEVDFVCVECNFPHCDTEHEGKDNVAIAAHATSTISRPVFASGNFTPKNLPDLLAAGIKRVLTDMPANSAGDTLRFVQEMLALLAG